MTLKSFGRFHRRRLDVPAPPPFLLSRIKNIRIIVFEILIELDEDPKTLGIYSIFSNKLSHAPKIIIETQSHT